MNTDKELHIARLLYTGNKQVKVLRDAIQKEREELKAFLFEGEPNARLAELVAPKKFDLVFDDGNLVDNPDTAFLQEFNLIVDIPDTLEGIKETYKNMVSVFEDDSIDELMDMADSSLTPMPDDYCTCDYDNCGCEAQYTREWVQGIADSALNLVKENETNLHWRLKELKDNELYSSFYEVKNSILEQLEPVAYHRFKDDDYNVYPYYEIAGIGFHGKIPEDWVEDDTVEITTVIEGQIDSEGDAELMLDTGGLEQTIMQLIDTLQEKEDIIFAWSC